MNSHRVFERVLSVIMLVAEFLVVIGAAAYIFVAQEYPIAPSEMWWTAIGMSLIIFFYCIFFLNKENARPLIVLIVSLISLAICVAIIIGCINADYSYYIDNPNYEQELEAWYAAGNLPFIDTKPPRHIRTYPPISGTLDGFIYIIGIGAILIAVAYIGYALSAITRLFNPSIQTRKAKRSIVQHEKAYDEIAKFHDYMERGIMTEEEYQENRQRILDTLDNHSTLSAPIPPEAIEVPQIQFTGSFFENLPQHPNVEQIKETLTAAVVATQQSTMPALKRRIKSAMIRANGKPSDDAILNALIFHTSDIVCGVEELFADEQDVLNRYRRVFDTPEVAGLDPALLDDGFYHMGNIYAMFWYGITGTVAEPHVCVALNHIHADAIELALAELSDDLENGQKLTIVPPDFPKKDESLAEDSQYDALPDDDQKEPAPASEEVPINWLILIIICLLIVAVGVVIFQ